MRLNELGHQVMTVDRDEGRVSECMFFATNAQIGDSTSVSFLRSLGVSNYDVCYVTISGNFQNAFETTSLIKELGARYVVSRAPSGMCRQNSAAQRRGRGHLPGKQLARWSALV